MLRSGFLLLSTLYVSLFVHQPLSPIVEAGQWDGWEYHVIYKDKFDCPDFDDVSVLPVEVHNKSVYKDRIIPGEYSAWFNLNVKEELAKDTTIRSEFLFSNSKGLYRMTFENKLCDLASSHSTEYCNVIWDPKTDTCPCPPTVKEWATWTDGLTVNFPLPQSEVFDHDCEMELRVYLETAETDHEDVRKMYACTGLKAKLKWIKV
ncbi:unnamed protein product [Cyprideis torosa]|uniref:Uncharacterized protein n=1 Tax=Cyprideis torosa TaxID=163714 RepID=A0A7R8ZPY3_9CRUS|nr:unnamed protein product [Cyprideis torosa]CAG0895057.1 unnamed protein product [Cyprideis torosa]